MQTYSEVFKRFKNNKRLAQAASKRYQKVADARFIAAFKKKYPKKKLPKYFRQEDDSLYFEIFNSILPRYSAKVESIIVRGKALEETLNQLAAGDIPQTNEFREVFSSCSYDYWSMGFGASKYARDAVDRKADMLIANGIEFRIEVVPQGSSKDGCSINTYKLFAPLDEAGWDQLNRRPIDLVEYVRKCWERGVNPRVMMPLLPHGFEEENGLDYFGGKK